MPPPPGVNLRVLQRAIERFTLVVGAEWVFTRDDETTLRSRVVVQPPCPAAAAGDALERDRSERHSVGRASLDPPEAPAGRMSDHVP